MTKLLKLGLLVVVFFMSTIVWGQDAENRRAAKKLKKQKAFKELMQAVNDKSIEFEADWAYPMGYNTVDLNGNSNYLRISNDSAFIDMPYFGRAYQVTLGERGGFHAETIMENKVVKVNDKRGEIKIEFSLKGESDKYQCTLEIMGKNSVTLRVTSNNRSSISYRGKFEEWIKKKK